jgi:hypothetical protein
MFYCKVLNRILKKILLLWYTKEPSVTIREYPITLDGKMSNMYVITSVSVDRCVKKCVIDYSYSRPIEYSFLSKQAESPWLWIGASGLCGECDMTASVLPYVVEGNHITIELLDKEFPFHRNWRYLDPVTFKEVDFPIEGITIDAPELEETTEEVQEANTT